MDVRAFKRELLLQLYKPYQQLKSCPVNTDGCTRLVFGEGDPNAKIVFIGEAPGRDEDALGRPFVGRSGQLLTKDLKALGLERTDVFITNIVKCRPPNNRKPLPAEVAFFKPLLFQELKIIRPKVICTLGSSALESLVNEPFSMTKIRGKPLQFDDMVLLPTFHPAYILRNPAAEQDFKEDLKEAIRIANKADKEPTKAIP
jgi:uracil-DNA glycosylase